jgi:hypothetical protein
MDPSLKRPDTVVNQVIGLLWYHMIFAHHPLAEHAADDLAAALTTQLRNDQEG